MQQVELHSELVYTNQIDGWKLALHRRSPKTGPTCNHPILMVHGIGANRLNLDLDDRFSIARYMARLGFDVFVLELRGTGMSKHNIAGKRKKDY